MTQRKAMPWLWVCLLWMWGCDGASSSTATSTLRGRVFSADDGRAVSMASVALTSGEATKTDEKGRFELSTDKSVGRVEVERQDYAPVSKNAPAGDGYVELFPKKFDAVQTVDVKAGGFIEAKGARVELVPDSLRTKGGEVPEKAEVRIAVPKTDKPTEVSGLPGDFKAKSGNSKGQIAIESPIYVGATGKDDDGLVLDKNKAAHVTLPEPRGAEKEESDLFKYNEEEQVWEKRGKATRSKAKQVGSTLEADIDELGWWSTGTFLDELTCVRGCVQDAEGMPALGTLVSVSGVGFAAEFSAYAAERGCFALDVPASVQVLVSAKREGAFAEGILVATGAPGPSTAKDRAQCVEIDTLRLVDVSEQICPLGLTRCGESCVDSKLDANHCGGCDLACSEGSLCASGQCETPVTCSTGFVPDAAGMCIDVDECADDNGGCAQSCVNTEGAFACTCDVGYVLDADGRGCTFSATCMMLGCAEHALCADGPSGLACVCEPGYEGDGTLCTDIDECGSANGGCDALTVCLNTDGSRTCGECPNGYTGTGASGCKDIDECAAKPSPCGAHSICTNNVGAAPLCACQQGFIDIDETSAFRCAWPDARLANLTVSAGSLGVPFAPALTSYNVQVPAANSTITVTPQLPETAVATITVNGSPVVSGTPSSPIALALGTSTVSVVVTAETGATQTYTLNVSRTHRELLSFNGPKGSEAELGASVALSADGLTAVVGAPGDGSALANDPANDSAPRAGAVYVYVFSTSAQSWSVEAYLKPSDVVAGAEFGQAVSVSANGDVLLVGAPGSGTTPVSGAAYLFERSQGKWSQTQRFGSATSPQGFGKATAVSGDGSALAMYDGDGSALVVVRGQSGFTTTLRHDNGDADDAFGASLSFSSDGQRLAVGAPLEDSVTGDPSDNSLTDAGAAYIFSQNGTGFTQLAAVKALAPDAGDSFGQRVSLSANGTTLAVSAPFEDGNSTLLGGDASDNNLTDSGAAYVFSEQRQVFRQTVYLKAETSVANGHFGQALALNGGGDHVFVGSMGPYGGQEGAVDVFYSPEGWFHKYTTQWDYPQPNEAFGAQLAVDSSGATILVGAPGQNDASLGIGEGWFVADGLAPNAGMAAVYGDNGEGASLLSTFKPASVDALTGYGQAIAISRDGSTIAVGAPDDDGNTTGIRNVFAQGEGAPGSGAVLVYQKTSNGWVLEAFIKASNADAQDYFGKSVALSADGSVLLVGAPGEDSSFTGTRTTLISTADNAGSDGGMVYMFTRAGTAWTETRYFKPSVDTDGDEFGAAVALSADANTVVVGAPLEDSGFAGTPNPSDNNVSDAGAVYVFSRSVEGFPPQGDMLKASNTRAAFEFGRSLALSSDGLYLAVGAPNEDSTATGIDGDENSNDAPKSGAVYLFSRAANGPFSQEAYIKASNTDIADNFGTSVALSGNGQILVVGSPFEDGDSDQNQTSQEGDSGAAYRFSRTGKTWSQVEYVKGPSIQNGALFGKAVALSDDGSLTLVGAPSYFTQLGFGATFLLSPGLPAIYRGHDMSSPTYGEHVAISGAGGAFVVSETSGQGGYGAIWIYE